MADHSLSKESYHLTRKSTNRKTGPIPVSTSSNLTCPESCPLKKACYAKHGPLAIHWSQVTSGKRGKAFNAFLQDILALPEDQLWRHNEAGDLPGKGDCIDSEKLVQLVEANHGKRGFTYTHKPVLDQPKNAEAVKHANENGFTVNLSADSLEEADQLKELGIAPVVVVLINQKGKSFTTPGGNRIAICPNFLDPGITCKTCQLCQRAERKAIIGFPVHGSGKKHFQAD